MVNNKVKTTTGILIVVLLCTIFPIHAQSFNQHASNLSVSTERAMQIVDQFLTIKEKNQDFTICSYDLISEKSNNTILAYVFHFYPKGYIITSASIYLQPVIAYSFTSDTSSVITSSPLYQLITADISNRIECEDYIPIEIKERNREEWNNLREPTFVKTTTDFQQWPPEGTTVTEGWIETTWSQDSPYNDLCPLDLNAGARSVAGCPSIAMSQILNYHKTTNNIQFNDSDDYLHNYIERYYIDDDYETYDFASFPILNDYLNTLQNHYETGSEITDTDVAALVFACRVAAEQVYSAQGSGTFGVSQAMDAYERFNCNNAKLYYKDSSDEVYDKIIWNIKHSLPVHFAVVTPAWNAGHNLIIDGYNTDEYYHLNFGWGGMYDGWYDLPDEIPYDLSVIEGVILDIFNSSDAADLVASGSIQLADITPGSTINGNFTIRNDGESYSSLSWEIKSFPEWGTWHFSQEYGNELTPEQGEITIDVSVELPSEKSKTYTGGIKIVNKNSPNDFDIIPLSISTPQNKQISFKDYWKNIFLHFIKNIHYPRGMLI